MLLSLKMMPCGVINFNSITAIILIAYVLQAVINFAGGWNLSGDHNSTLDAKERIYR
jgi:hypothetical protein